MEVKQKMPNALISLYLTDEDYFIYKNNKEKINSKTREIIKDMIKKIKK